MRRSGAMVASVSFARIREIWADRQHDQGVRSGISSRERFLRQAGAAAKTPTSNILIRLLLRESVRTRLHRKGAY